MKQKNVATNILKSYFPSYFYASVKEEGPAKHFYKNQILIGDIKTRQIKIFIKEFRLIEKKWKIISSGNAIKKFVISILLS